MLFPEYIARSVRQGMEEGDILPHITAAVTRFDAMDYRSITSEAGGEEKRAAPSRRGDRDPQHHGQGAGESGEPAQAGPDAGGQL